MTRLINFFGAPGSGKTTATAEAFVKAKKKGLSAYLIQEYATELVLQGDFETLKDQKKVFAEQLRRINQVNTKMDYVMVDSPLLSNVIYQRYWTGKQDKDFEKKVLAAHNAFDSINVLLKYNPKNYTPNGRVTSKDESFIIENQIRDLLKSSNVPFIEVENFEELESCLDNIIEKGAKK